MNNIVPFEQQLHLADAFCKSGLFGIRTRDQAIALMAICEAEGLHPAKAVQEYHIIQGRPALKADAMLARFQAAGGKVKWTSMTDQLVAGEFSHAQGGSVEIDWTIEMAKRAGLTKNPTWNQYPRAMLRARCISEGIRTVFPGCVVGTYTPEEAGDMEPREPVRMRDMGTVDEVASPVHRAPTVTLDAVLDQIALTVTLEGLELVRPMMRSLPAEDRKEAIAAAQARANQIRIELEPPPASDADAGDGAL